MAVFDLSVHRYVQLARMKRASHRLTHDRDSSVTEIALEAGYDAPDAFARAFRKRVAQSPSAFREAPDWGPWLMAFGPLHNARNLLMQSAFAPSEVTIREVPETAVAVMEHRGPRASIPETAARFHAWRKANGLSPKTSSSFTAFRSEHLEADETGYALDLCVEIHRPVALDDYQVKSGVIPGGRCAVMQVDGTSNNHRPAALYLSRDWLPKSGEEAGDFPMYCQRRLLLESGDAQEVFAELFLPLR